jgi:SAM-dependent methyltransferase
MHDKQDLKKWHNHEGVVEASENGFDVIDCQFCGFKHIVPIPTVEELETVYQHDYYNQKKPLYLEHYQEDSDWWNIVYSRRYEVLEQHLPVNQRSLLDIGSGPGLFLLNGQRRGWQVQGIEPSVKALEHSRGLGLDITSGFYSSTTAKELGPVDVINMSLVLEHISDPIELLKAMHQQLNVGGLVSIIVPNDFNPFQLILRDHLGFDPWWVAPPHHINYFNFKSLSALLEKCGFEVLHQESTFPIDMFLLMGDNYIGNVEVGRACHTKRMNFEKAMLCAGNGDILANMYSSFADQNLGREVVIYARVNKRG